MARRPVLLSRSTPTSLPSLLCSSECFATMQVLRSPYLRASEASIRVSVGDGSGCHYGVQHEASSSFTTVSEFLGAFNEPCPAASADAKMQPFYLAQHRLDDMDHPSPLAQLLAALPPLPSLIRDRASHTQLRTLRTNVWMSLSASETNCHYDDEDNLLVTVHGSKEVAVAEPGLCMCSCPADGVPRSGAPAFGPAISLAAALHHRPDVNLFAVAARAACSAVSGSACVYCGTADKPAADAEPCRPGIWTAVYTLGPGDALYLPAGFWHQVRSEPRTVAVNHWFAPHSLQGLMDGDDADDHEHAPPTRDASAAALDPAPSIRDDSGTSREGVAAVGGAGTAMSTAPAGPGPPSLCPSSSWPFVARSILSAGLDDALQARLRDWRCRCTAAAASAPGDGAIARAIEAMLLALHECGNASVGAAATHKARSSADQHQLLLQLRSSLSALLRLPAPLSASPAAAASDGTLLSHSASWASHRPGPADALLLGIGLRGSAVSTHALRLLLSIAAVDPPSLAALCVSVTEETWACLASEWASTTSVLLPTSAGLNPATRDDTAGTLPKPSAAVSPSAEKHGALGALVPTAHAFEVLNDALRPHAEVVAARCRALQPLAARAASLSSAFATPISDLLDVSAATVRRHCLASLLTGLCGESIQIES